MNEKQLRLALDHLYDGHHHKAVTALRSCPDDPDLALLANLLDPDESIGVPHKLVTQKRKPGRTPIPPSDRLDRRYAAYEAVRDRKPGTKVRTAIADYAKAEKRSESAVRAEYEAMRRKMMFQKKPKKSSSKMA